MRRLAALAGALVLMGCAGSPAPVPAAGPPVDELRIGLQDYRLQLSAARLVPGPVTVTVTNTGSTRHDVVLRQGDEVVGRTEVLAPGAGQTVQVQVRAGTPVDLECTVAGHAAAGMTATMAVVQAGPAGQSNVP